MGIWDEYKQVFKDFSKTLEEEVKYQKHKRNSKSTNASEDKPNSTMKQHFSEMNPNVIPKKQSIEEKFDIIDSPNIQIQVSEKGQIQHKSELEEDIWNNKSKTVLLLLTFFLGSLGVHKFYTGNWIWGLIYLSLVTTGASLTFSMIEYLHILCMSKKSFDAKYNKRRIKAFTFTW